MSRIFDNIHLDLLSTLRVENTFYEDFAVGLPRADISRLMNAANDMIDSLDATNDFERKLLRRVKSA